MPVTVNERYESRRHSGSSGQREYLIEGTTDETTARANLLSNAPGSIGGLNRRDRDCEVTQIGDSDQWYGLARYEKPELTPASTGDSQFAFDTTGGMQHILASRQTNSAFGDGAAVGDNGNLIGATREGVTGVEITVPVYKFTETHYLSNGTVTTAYKSTLFDLTGKTNDGAFKGLSAGEGLFLGAQGSTRSEDDWEITFHFAGSPNLTGITIGDINGISKKGWEYLWVRYEPAEVGDLKIVTQKPVAVYVEKVYEEGSFGSLGIGT